MLYPDFESRISTAGEAKICAMLCAAWLPIGREDSVNRVAAQRIERFGLHLSPFAIG
jgi:hypothetical protein